FRRRIVTSLLGLIVSGVAVLFLGLLLSSGYALGLGAMATIGFMLPIVNGPIFALLQTVVAPEMHGRVFTVVGSLSGAMSPLGLAVAGPVADALGVQTWYILGGAACVLMGLGGFLLPPVLHIEDRPDQAVPGGSETSLPASAPADVVAD
ncbi:MAG: hypothetical protein M3380_21120, partial [Chloroflexota bacterium]|nr:hypothetical protein [Chloroflexota bacterium]